MRTKVSRFKGWVLSGNYQTSGIQNLHMAIHSQGDKALRNSGNTVNWHFGILKETQSTGIKDQAPYAFEILVC